MKTDGKSLDDILEIKPYRVFEEKSVAVMEDKNEQEVTVVEENKYDKDFTEDFNFARKNIQDNITMSNRVLSKLEQVIDETESPRNFEVFSQLVKVLTESNKTLLEIHEKQREVLNIKTQTNTNTTNIQNAVFTGSLDELNKLIQKRKQQNGNTD